MIPPELHRYQFILLCAENIPNHVRTEHSCLVSGHDVPAVSVIVVSSSIAYQRNIRFLYNGIIIKHQKTEPTYTKTSLFLCEKRRFFMARREKGVVPIIYFEKERGKSF